MVDSSHDQLSKTARSSYHQADFKLGKVTQSF